MPAATTTDSKPARHRPKSYTVFAAAFLAGAAAAVGVNRVLDVQVAQRRPLVECEPIFVALRPLPQGSPVTVWDVALKDWPKAMLPTSALRAGDAFEGYVLRHAVREGQPLLAVQLVRSGSGEGQTATEAFVPATPVPTRSTAETSSSADLWTPAESAPAQPAPPPATPAAPAAVAAAPAPAPAVAVADPTPAATVAESVAPPSDAVTTAPVPAREQQTDEAPAVAPTTPEPTVAAMPESSEPAVAAAPAKEPTPAPALLAAQPAVAPPGDVEDDASEAVATDVSSMPSVMAAPTTSGPAPPRPTTNDAGRFLVVPERIALQADTSFTTPRPEPPGPPPTARPAPQARQRPTTPAAPRTGQTTPRTQPAPAPAKGQPRPQSQQPQRSSQASSNAKGPKGWGGMFPNVAAGIEAIGGQWQRGRSTADQSPRSEPSVNR